MRSPLRNAVSRSCALAALLACSGDPSPSIMLALNTNDLVISSDTNLVGLYVAQLGANGRVLAVEAHEAAPLRRDDGTVEVPFPASLLLADATETQGVHVKLVAFRGASRTPLTMRESRTQLPNEGQRLLRLNLYFTNQDNVSDSAPGTNVLDEGSSLASGGDLSFRNATGPIPQNQFDRFTSLCDGAPAPAGKTAGDDGRCVDLDIDVNTLPFREDPGALVPGANPQTDSCYDVGRAFSLWEDGAIGHFDRAAIDALPTTGECRIDLPAAYDPARLNVAMSTTEAAFETRSNPHDPNSPTTIAPSLRPLPLGVAYRHEGNSIVLPAHVCAVVRRAAVQELLFSQRTVAWRGEEPVCAPWSHAKVPHDYSGAPPSPLPPAGGPEEGGIGDAGAPDGEGGTPRSFADYALEPNGTVIRAIAAGDGRVALAELGANGHGVAVLEPSRFDAYALGARGAALLYPSGASVYGPVLDSLRVAGRVEFYSSETEGSALWHVGNTIELVNGPWGGEQVVPAALWDGPALAWLALEPQSAFVVQRLASPTTLEVSPFIQHPRIDTTGNLLDGFGVSFGGTTIFTPGNGGYVKCEGSACTDELVTPADVYGIQKPAQTNGTAISLALSQNALGNVLYHYETDSTTPLPPNQRSYDLVAGGGHFCFVGADAGDLRRVLCFTAANGQASRPTALFSDTFSTFLAADEQYLYATYQCTYSDDPEQHTAVYVARVSWAEVGASPSPFVNRCVVQPDGDAGDAGDGGPGPSTADASTHADAAPPP